MLDENHGGGATLMGEQLRAFSIMWNSSLSFILLDKHTKDIVSSRGRGSTQHARMQKSVLLLGVE